MGEGSGCMGCQGVWGCQNVGDVRMLGSQRVGVYGYGGVSLMIIEVFKPLLGRKLRPSGVSLAVEICFLSDALVVS